MRRGPEEERRILGILRRAADEVRGGFEEDFGAADLG